MKRWQLFVPLGIFALLAVLLWRGLSLDPSHMPSALLDRPVPAFSLPTLAGEQPVDESIFRGQVSLINVWATWCITCRVEHPFLMELAEQGIPIVGVNYKDDSAEARRWLEKLGDPYQLSVVDADGRLGIDLGVYGAPETYVVDADGVIRYKHVGEVNAKVWRETLQPIVVELQGADATATGDAS